MRLFELEHEAGIEHVLRRRAEMQVLAVTVAAFLLQRAQRRDQRMLGAADLGADRRKVDILDLGLRGDFQRGGLRDDPELGLRQRQRGLVVEPFLHAVLVAEDCGEFLRSPDVSEQGGIENPGRHAAPRVWE